MKPVHYLVIATVVASMGYPRAALAETSISNAVNVCQGSLPSFEGALRKRPLAIKNEGAITAFVSCSLRVPTESTVYAVSVAVTNKTTGPKTVSCTLVDGIALPFANLPPVYWPMEKSAASGEAQIFSWLLEDPEQLFNLPNINCALPPGVEINVVLAFNF